MARDISGAMAREQRERWHVDGKAYPQFAGRERWHAMDALKDRTGFVYLLWDAVAGLCKIGRTTRDGARGKRQRLLLAPAGQFFVALRRAGADAGFS